MKRLLTVLFVLGLAGCARDSGNGDGTLAYERSAQVVDNELIFRMEITPEQMFKLEEGPKRLRDAIYTAAPNFRKHSLAESWINTALLTLKSRQDGGEHFPLEMKLTHVHPITLKWIDANHWELTIEKENSQQVSGAVAGKLRSTD